ncbi:MAG: hypothetical protein R3A11_02160 [Bdellovibrionota bacterium]
MKRPLAITLISVFLIFGSLASTVYAWLLFHPELMETIGQGLLPKVTRFEQSIVVVSILVGLTAGPAMLLGHHWGRMVYSGWRVCGVILSFFNPSLMGPSAQNVPSSLGLVKGITIVVLFLELYYLFNRQANAYFLPEKNQTL